jgi:hypothetical protein
MKTEIQIFTDLAWQEKINYMVTFYQGMIKKTDNSEYISKFQAKIDEVQWYTENEANNGKLIALYGRIITAREKTKERKLEEMKQHIEEEKKKIARIEANKDEQNPDEYLAEAMSNI